MRAKIANGTTIVRVTLSAFFLFVLLISFLTFRSAVQQPLHLDEADEATMGLKFSQVGPATWRPVEDGGVGMAISHPLLYTFSHALIQRFFGAGEFPLRIYGVFHYLLCLFLLLLIVGELVDGDIVSKRIGMACAAVLYLVNPLLIQHSVVVNADNSILTTTILLFLFFYLRFERLGLKGRDYIVSRLKLAFLLALCFWAKELTPLFMMVGVFLYRLMNRDFKKLWIDLFCVGICGFLIFWFTWWLTCALAGIDVLGFVKFTFLSKIGNYTTKSFGVIFSEVFFYGFRWHIYWVSAPFFIALLMFIIVRSKAFLKERRWQHVDLVFIIACAIFLPFQFFRPSKDMVKYHYPAYPLFIACISWLFAKAVEARRQMSESPLLDVRNLAFVCASLFVLTLHYYLMGDYLLGLWRPLLLDLNLPLVVLYFFPLFLVLFGVFLGSKSVHAWDNLVVAVVVMILPINMALCLNQAQANYATVEIWGNYGEAGVRETAQYLSEHLEDGDSLSARIDIAYYLAFVHKIKLKVNTAPDILLILLDRNPDVVASMPASPYKFFVFDSRSQEAAGEIKESTFKELEKYFVFDRQIGGFQIYRRKGIQNVED